jgi:hypothetical protein
MRNAGTSEGVRPSGPVAASFFSDRRTPFVDYALTLIDGIGSVRLTPIDDGANSTPVDVYYGNDKERPCLLRIPWVAGYSVASVPGLPDKRSDFQPGDVFPYDLFSAVRFWLADEAHQNAPDTVFDEHGRLRPERSAQELIGVREIPVVNAYLLQVRSWIAARLRIPESSHLPPGKRGVVVLSHDVDSPIDPGSPWHATALAFANLRRGIKVGASAAYACGAAQYAVRSRFRDPRGRHCLFQDVMGAEERKGFRSTFFFAATSRFSINGCRRDVAYDVTRSPLRPILPQLIGRGHTVGLHVGYLARADAGHIESERERLEDVAGAPVRGSRHHYYHMTRPFWASLAAHGQAGLRFDSSISYNHAPGYRLGIALPFQPWNPETGRPVSTIQIPTMLMDSMLMTQPGQSVEAAVERTQGLLTNLKRFEGVAALDWHEYTSFPGSKRYRLWGETYLALLDLLAGDPEICVQTYEEAISSRAH